MAQADEKLVRSMTVLEMAFRVHQELNDRASSAAGLTLNQAVVLSEVERSNARATVSELAATLGRAVHTPVGQGARGVPRGGYS